MLNVFWELILCSVLDSGDSLWHGKNHCEHSCVWLYRVAIQVGNT